MRRWILTTSFLFLLFIFSFHMQIVGLILKTVTKSKTNSLLAFRELHFKGRSLILKGAVLFDSSYLLNSEKIALTWKRPFSLSIHVEKPHILLSPEHFKYKSSATKSRFGWSIQLEEGTLEWGDRSLPSSQFSLLLTSDENLEMGMSWEQGVLEIEKRENVCHAEWDHLPLDFLLVASLWSGFSFPISDCKGTFSGHADLVEKKLSLKATGEALSFEWQKLRFGGALSLEGTFHEHSLEKIVLSLKEGHVQSFPSEIKNIESHLTYHSDLGIKVTGHGVAAREALQLGVEWEGKSFTQEWAEGRVQFGSAVASVDWDRVHCENLGPPEISILQGFAAKFFPTIGDWNWQSGTLQVDAKNLNLTNVELENVNLETPLFTFETKKGSYKKGNWEIENFHISRNEISIQGNGKWHSEIEGNKVVFNGEIANIDFAGVGEFEKDHFTLSIPHFKGALPSLWPESYGHIEATGSGLEINGLTDWLLSCKITDGFFIYQNCTLSNIQCNLVATPDSLDFLATRAELSAPIGEKPFSASLFAPRIQWKGETALFDLRLHDGPIDLLRLKGTKESEVFQLDPTHSHFFGQPISLKAGIWQRGTFPYLALETDIDWPLFESYLPKLGLDLWKGFPKLGKIHFCGHLTEEKIGFSLLAAPFTLNTEKRGNLWSTNLLLGATQCHFALEYKEGLFRTHSGRVAGPTFAFDFEGTMNRKLEGALTLKKIWADLKEIPSIRLEGNVEGQAQVYFTKEEIQSDLDLVLKEAFFEGFSLENEGPLHLSYSSLQGTRINGIDCRIHKDNLEAHAKMDLLKFEKLSNQWTIQKAKTHIPADFLTMPFFDKGGYLDCLADLSFSSDFTEWVCTIKEALLPIGGSSRHVKDLRAIGKEGTFFSEGFLNHRAKWAKLSLETHLSPLHGRLYLEEIKGENPLSIDWSYEKETGLSILSIEGAFGGIDASFHAFERGKLIGSSRVDFRRLSEWLPPEVARGFEELKLGKGYELKGNLQIDPKQLSNITFQGIFSGKQIELAGFQFRTLLARAQMDPTFYRIYDVKISDSAGGLKIDDIRIKQEKNQPWTIEIPQFIIEELRPSLLVKPGVEPTPLSPLVVRHLKMVDFHGLLDDGKTWLATGELSFINSFKREQTLFDFPVNVLGRIVGLDLDLLIPVKGELTFDLKDGYFNLGQLKRSYSEGQRSEFFLVQTDTEIPRMDLDGNLQILVKMEQFVLFSLTKAFMISIGGKLNDPHFSLQKKRF